MTTKEWLLRGWKINDELELIKKQKEEAFNRATAITANTKDILVSTGGYDPHRYERYIELSQKLDAYESRLLDIKSEILEVIERVPDSVLRQILLSRYIQYKSWEKIAIEMNYSYMHICRLHGKALDAAKDVIECYIPHVL